jgi:hypothetical protein
MEVPMRPADDSADVFAVSGRELEALLDNLPSAHGCDALRITGESGRWRMPRGRRFRPPGKRAKPMARAPWRIRFVYFANVDDHASFVEYHHALVSAEVLLDRVFAACALGLVPVHPSLEASDEEQLYLRPHRGSFARITPEYRRWYSQDDLPRQHPLTLEELAVELAREHSLAHEDATERAANQSGALRQADQAWLIARSRVAVNCRPLHATEFRALVDALEAVYDVPRADPAIVRANTDIALRAAATLGAVMKEFVPAPFGTPALAQAFASFHCAHLQRVADASRRTGMLQARRSATLSWFSAKRARMHAELQARLAAR